MQHTPSAPHSPTWISWNQQIRHSYDTLVTPASLEELQEAVRQAGQIRCVGTGKSSSDICAGIRALVSLEQLDRLLASGSHVDPAGGEIHYVQVEAGIMLGDLVKALEARGLCLPALPDIDNISLGGALSTGTHGTGHAALSLSDYLIGCTLVAADGRAVHSGFRPPAAPDQAVPALAGQLAEGPELDALQVSLGLLGILYAPVLRVEPLFHLALEEQAVSNAVWTSQWRRWQEEQDFTRILFLPHTGQGWYIAGNRFEGVPPFEAQPAPAHHRNRRKTSARLYGWFGFAPRLTALANRFMRWRYFNSTIRKLGTLYGTSVTTSRSGSGTMVLAEWAIPFERFDRCFAELQAVLEAPGNPAGVHIPMDVRFYRQSRAWLSNAWEGDTVSLGCVCRVPEKAGLYRAFGIMEGIFLKHGGRPHWAKHFAAGPEVLRQLYPRYQDFVDLRRQWDPSGKFLNSWLAAYFA